MNRIGIRKQWFIFFVMMGLLWLVSACSQPVPVVPEKTATLPVVVPTQTAPAMPTETPQPGRVVLVAPMSISAAAVNQAQTRLAALSDNVGMTFEVRELISDTDIGSDWKIVVFMETPENIQSLQNANPAVQFVIMSENPSVNGAANLSVIYTSRIEQAFMAGYMTILSAPDFRAGGMLLWDDPVQGALIQDAFKNGAAYFCGRCPSVYMPVTLFPVTTSLPGASSPADWQEAFTNLNTQYIVYTVYVTEEGSSQEVLNALANMNVLLLGAKTPNDMTGLRWAGTVSADPVSALESIWTDLAAGLGGHTIQTPVVISDVNDDYLSPGRMRLVEETLALLMDGAILPQSPEYP